MFMKKPIGQIVAGSLSEGLSARINPSVASDQIKTGKFVSILSGNYTFFSLITDLKLEVTNPDILLFPPMIHEKLLTSQLLQRDMYTVATLKPMLMMDTQGAPTPVKTVPAHFAPVCQADTQDVTRIFGHEDDTSKRYFRIGTPLDMDIPVCIDLDRLTERSNGIFGKTGTGKTFLTRVLLAGLIKQEKAVTLIFDMHSEYGLQARKEGPGHSFVKGLKTLFPDRVAIFSLDPASTRRRAGNPDVEIVIPYSAIHVEDIVSLQSELNLHSTAVEASYLIAAHYKHNWLSALLSSTDNIKEFAQGIGAHPESIAALYRKLKRIERLDFLVESSTQKYSFIDQMLEYINRGISVIVEFGNYTENFVYLLVANIITRRLHAEYISRTEKFLGSQRKEDEPKKLMICIEEAHKFLNPTSAKQTIFGTIAREMRKYYVSLLVVDQRPSGIDQEILSQLGTKIVAQLNDEKDIQAALTGTHASTGLRSILASLDSKKQALVFGHAMAMPMVIQPREYDETFYKDMGTVVSKKQIDQFINELF